MRNWARNIDFSAESVQRPRSVAEVVEIVKHAVSKGKTVRCVGTGHSFNRIADSQDCLVSLSKMNSVLGVDERKRIVKVEGGITYGALALWLEERGWALHNLASLPHISVAGAVATGTHGSGVNNPSLASAVVALDVVGHQGVGRLLFRVGQVHVSDTWTPLCLTPADSSLGFHESTRVTHSTKRFAHSQSPTLCLGPPSLGLEPLVWSSPFRLQCNRHSRLPRPFTKGSILTAPAWARVKSF